ncbi:MAG: hypothetical protein PHF57_02505 [Methanoregula sp.]|nr:hypothetical protein [Methanoregula sp.]MDD5024113.1 hypothetical protein [Methanoregula sp.]MDD5187059.1 hypothetical protein [Methanoregula sp.]
MSGVIFLIQGEKLVELREEKYDSEDLLQTLLADYPKILAGDQICSENPRRWLLISREMGIPDDDNASNRWALDHLFIDQEGIPTLVEVKRSTDTRTRREVVAQMLDYAANGIEYWKISEIKVQFEQQCLDAGKTGSDVVQEALGRDIEYEKIWEQIESNLKTGKLRLLFVADEIPRELRRIVEFLNQQMKDVEVLAVEVKQFTGEGLKTLVPRVIGQTAMTEEKVSLSSKNWDKDSFLNKIEEDIGKAERSSMVNLLQWFEEKQIRFRFGKGQKSASCLIYSIQKDGKEVSPFSISSDTSVSIRFDRIKNNFPYNNPEKRKALINEISEKIGRVKSGDKIDAWPSFSISLLNSEERLEQFKKIILQVMTEINQ